MNTNHCGQDSIEEVRNFIAERDGVIARLGAEISELRRQLDLVEARVRELDALNEMRLGEIRTTLKLRADARREAAEWKTRAEHYKQVGEQSEADSDLLRIEAADDIASWGAYASEYFQQKHDLPGCIAKYREAKASALTAAIEHARLQERARTAMTMLDIADDLLDDFLKHIDNSCDGDHPSREDVECWLVEYGRMHAGKATTDAPTGEEPADAIRERTEK